jgi:hypothetical protein
MEGGRHEGDPVLPVSQCRRILTRQGVLVAVGGPDNGRWIAPLMGPVKLLGHGVMR